MTINLASPQSINPLKPNNLRRPFNNAININTSNISSTATIEESGGVSLTISTVALAKLARANEEMLEPSVSLSDMEDNNANNAFGGKGSKRIYEVMVYGKTFSDSSIVDGIRNAPTGFFNTHRLSLAFNKGLHGNRIITGVESWEAHDRVEAAGGISIRSFYHLGREYVKIRQELKDRYTGEELDQHLQQLSADFDSFIEEMANGAETNIRRAFEENDKEAIELILMWLNLDIEEVSIVDIIAAARNYIMQMGNWARQFALENSHVASEQESRNSFNEFTANNAVAFENAYVDNLE